VSTTYLTRPDLIRRGQLLWLELEELRPPTHVAVRVVATIARARRADVRVLGSFEASTVSVDYARLFEEAP